MKKTPIILLLFPILFSAFFISGCGNKTKKTTPEASQKESPQMESLQGSSIDYYAYDTVFALLFATMERENYEHQKESDKDLKEEDRIKNIHMEKDGETINFTFDKAPYLKEGDATVSGHMKAINVDPISKSDVKLNFENDPEGLKEISIQSSGKYNEKHDKGEIFINGEKKVFSDFLNYVSSKSPQK